KEAVLEMYGRGLPVSKIQRAFSVGAFGIEKNRRFVPTRWSITAVDDTIGKDLRETVKTFPLINEIRIFETIGFDDRFLVVMVPRPWRYELIEAWYPNTLWNPLGREVVMFGDHEGFEGRTTYASIGGCYYAARLAVGEALNRDRRQAATVILRETHPGYIMPVGVWNVREDGGDPRVPSDPPGYPDGALRPHQRGLESRFASADLRRLRSPRRRKGAGLMVRVRFVV